MKTVYKFICICAAILVSCSAGKPSATQPESTPKPASTIPPSPYPTQTATKIPFSETQIPILSRSHPDLPEGYTFLHTWCNDKQNAVHDFPQSASIGFKYGWTAVKESQIEDFLQIVDFELTLDGEPISFDGRTDTIYNEGTNDYSIWLYKLVGAMEPGPHRLEHIMVFTKKLEDGHDLYGPGTDFEKTLMSCDFNIIKE